MSTPPTPAKANVPLLTDEQIQAIRDLFENMDPFDAMEMFVGIYRKVFRRVHDDRTKLLADLAAMRDAGDKMCEALRYNLAVYARKDEPMMLKAMEAWDALTPPRNG